MRAYEIRPKRTVLDMVIRAFAVFGAVATFNLMLEASEIPTPEPKITKTVPCTYTLKDRGGNKHTYPAECTVDL
jgi:hypothetical protein